MAKILLVEDSNSFGVVITQKIETELSHPVIWKKNYAETKLLLETQSTEFFLAILDLRLPDACEGEIVDLVLEKNIPVLVVTTELNNELREKFFSQQIVDYILKNNIHCFDLVTDYIRRLTKNKETKILVVDDSKVFRLAITSLLQTHNYQIFEADNGKTALQRMAQHPDIKVVITDYTMPEMDGIELTKELRVRHKKENLAIIGLSAYGNTLLSAQFIKNGANDFLTKPFSHEEFYCRLTHIVETLEYIAQIRDASVKDYLTGLYNRRYLFDKGQQILDDLKKEQRYAAVTMLDIDHFKRINDTYGHDAGDKVLQFFAERLLTCCGPDDLPARIGGEEFCLLQPGKSPDAVFECVDALRKRIEQSAVTTADNKTIHFTVSAGICAGFQCNLEQMLSLADKMLYEAKNRGRNQVLIDYEPDDRHDEKKL